MRRRRKAEHEETVRLAKAIAAETRARAQLEQAQQLKAEAHKIGAEVEEWDGPDLVADAVRATFVGPGLVDLIRERLPWVRS